MSAPQSARKVTQYGQSSTHLQGDQLDISPYLPFFTGAQAVINPIAFSASFGLGFDREIQAVTSSRNKTDYDAVSSSRSTAFSQRWRSVTASYISLMGVGQLATSIILLTFVYMLKWTEIATILAIIGLVVAGTGGLYLARAGEATIGRFHATPVALLAALACAVLLLGE